MPVEPVMASRSSLVHPVITLKRSIFIQFAVAACLCVAHAAGAQAPSVTANPATGINQVRAGDFFTALFTLNQVVRQTSERPEDAPTLGRPESNLQHGLCAK